MLPVAFMLAAQAGGMIIDYLGRSQSNAMAKQGAALQQQAIERAIQYSRLQTEQESLNSMVALRKNLGTQSVMLAARGTREGAGSSILFSQESLAAFNTDERVRRLNQLATESKLRAGIDISKAQQKAFETQNMNAFITNAINTISTNPAVYKSLGESFGFGNGKSNGFGLNKVQPFKGAR